MGRYQKTFHGLVQDDRGRILGKVVTEDRELIRAEMDYVKKLLLGIYGETKQKRTMGNSNVALLTGKAKFLKIDGNRGFVSLDTETENCKFIPCTVFESKPLLEKLGRFAQGDEMKIVGFIRAWSQKKNDKWENHVEVRITEIKNEPPKREKKRADYDDNDIPEEYR